MRWPVLLAATVLLLTLSGATPGAPAGVTALFTDQAAVGGNTFTTAASFQTGLIGSWLTGVTHATEPGSKRALVFVAGSEHGGSVQLIGSWATGLSHAAPGGSNRALVFIAGNEHGASAATLSSVTFGGQPLTKVNDVTVGTTTTARVEIWILNEAGIAAASGSTFVPTWSASPNTPMYSHAFFSGADQATPVGAQATNSTASSTPNPITTSVLANNSGDMIVVGAVSGNNGSYTPQNGFSLGNNQTAGVTTTLGTAYNGTSGSAQTPSMQHSNPNRQVIAAFVLRALSSATPSLTSVTYGGQPLTKVNDVAVGTTFTAHVEIWVLNEAGIAAASGSTFVPTWSATPDVPMYSHAFFAGVDQATPVGAQATNSTASSTPNPITTSALANNSGDFVIVAAVAGNDGSYTPQNGFSLGNDQTGAATVTLATAYKTATGSSETPSMLHSNPNRQVIAAFVLKR